MPSLLDSDDLVAAWCFSPPTEAHFFESEFNQIDCCKSYLPLRTSRVQGPALTSAGCPRLDPLMLASCPQLLTSNIAITMYFPFIAIFFFFQISLYLIKFAMAVGMIYFPYGHITESTILVIISPAEPAPRTNYRVPSLSSLPLAGRTRTSRPAKVCGGPQLLSAQSPGPLR